MTLIKRKNKMKFILIILLSSCMQNNSIFYDKVLDDFDGYSWFLRIEVKSPFYSGEVIIENAELFYCLNQEKKIDKEQYKKILREKLENHLPIDIGSTTMCSFIKVPEIESVNTNAKKGIDEFIKTYFDGKVLKDGVTDDERTVIIQKLFEWEVASKIDDETGYLILNR